MKVNVAGINGIVVDKGEQGSLSKCSCDRGLENETHYVTTC